MIRFSFDVIAEEGVSADGTSDGQAQVYMGQLPPAARWNIEQLSASSSAGTRETQLTIVEVVSEGPLTTGRVYYFDIGQNLKTVKFDTPIRGPLGEGGILVKHEVVGGGPPDIITTINVRGFASGAVTKEQVLAAITFSAPAAAPGDPPLTGDVFID